MSIPACRVDDLHRRLGYAEPCALSAATRGKPGHAWHMEGDDAQVLSYLYAHHRPRRHLEFGTWEGFGARLCLQSCDATVWSINLREGEKHPDGGWAYYSGVKQGEARPGWANTKTTRSGAVVCQTDALGFVGRLVHEAGLGHRFCQVYCNSLDWDASNYPGGFFDSVLIDGGHTAEVVESDTRKALPLVRPGGLVMWHDWSGDDEVRRMCPSVRGVVDGVEAVRPWLAPRVSDLFWVEPSWLLVGVKA